MAKYCLPTFWMKQGWFSCSLTRIYASSWIAHKTISLNFFGLLSWIQIWSSQLQRASMKHYFTSELFKYVNWAPAKAFHAMLPSQAMILLNILPGSYRFCIELFMYFYPLGWCKLFCFFDCPVSVRLWYVSWVEHLNWTTKKSLFLLLSQPLIAAQFLK